jgi:hypothetical protein
MDLNIPEKSETQKKEKSGHDQDIIAPPDLNSAIDPKYADLLNDKKLKYLLGFKSLQVHLSDIYSILANNSPLPGENKLDLANDKLSQLRQAGKDENELVEEFCQHVISLLNS